MSAAAVDPYALELAAAMDPVFWAEKIVGPKVIPNFSGKLDDWQAKVLRTQERWVLLLCTRQAGKSTIAALKAAHLALYTPGSFIVVVSRGGRQALEVFATIEKCIYASERASGGTQRDEDNKSSIKLANGSRILSVPSNPDTIRGLASVSLLIEDEAAFVDDEVNDVVRPMLAVSKGQLMLLSTPYGQRGHFYAAWSGREAWDRYSITADKVARIAPEHIERERAEKGEFHVRQEYFCEFVSELDSVFTPDQIKAAISDDVEVLAW